MIRFPFYFNFSGWHGEVGCSVLKQHFLLTLFFSSNILCYNSQLGEWDWSLFERLNPKMSKLKHVAYNLIII